MERTGQNQPPRQSWRGGSNGTFSSVWRLMHR